MLIPFILGFVLLLIWLWPTGADRTALTLFVNSIPYFVVAPLCWGVVLGILAAIFGDSVNWFWPILVVGLVLEEMLKFLAARSQPVAIRAFALVALFGIWEVMLFKAVQFPVFDADPLFAAGRYATRLPAVTMHLLTAAIYAFVLAERPWLQLLVCASVHAAFNAAAFIVPPIYLWISAFAFCLVTVAMIPPKGSSRRGIWHDPAPAPDGE